MGTFSSLTPLFEKPISESTPSIFGSLVKSRTSQAVPDKQQPSFTEIFGELHFKESPPAPSLGTRESLQLCTEGLGFESSDDTEAGGGLGGAGGEEWGVGGGSGGRRCAGRASLRGFPPPIPSIGGSGKPSIAFEAFKGEGRFVLREVRVPSQELFLRPCREGGRLMLRLVQPDEKDDGGDGSDGDGVGDEDDDEEERREEE